MITVKKISVLDEADGLIGYALESIDKAGPLYVNWLHTPIKEIVDCIEPVYMGELVVKIGGDED